MVAGLFEDELRIHRIHVNTSHTYICQIFILDFLNKLFMKGKQKASMHTFVIFYSGFSNQLFFKINKELLQNKLIKKILY